MTAFYPLAIGCVVTIMTTLVLGIWLRRHPDIKTARITGRISHFVLIAALMLPQWGLSYPWLGSYDEKLGISPLPFGTLCGVVGALMLLAGLGLMVIAMLVLVDSGKGMAAFVLTKRVADEYIYRRTRNPMAMGFSLTCVALGLIAGSTFFTFWSLFVVVPTLVLHLKFFEERELEIRFDQAYKEYKNSVPFLIPRFSIRDCFPKLKHDRFPW